MSDASEVNKIQIGGTHYKQGEFDHWDWVTNNRMQYLPGVATKYLCRWREAYGMKDLKKVEHYVQKMFECFTRGEMSAGLVTTHPNYSVKALVNVYRLDLVEEQIIELLTFFRSYEDLATALEMVQGYIAHIENESAGEEPTSSYVYQG